jgi:hypothetical protein
MRKLLRKSNVEKLGIEPDDKHSRQDAYTKETRKSLTTLDTIALVALTMSPLGLLVSMLMSSGNRLPNENVKDE